MTLHSTSYDWLICGGPKCQFKGHGTVQRGRRLLVPADGNRRAAPRRRAGQAPDEIWVTLTGQVVYDNQVGDNDIADPTTVIGGGSIVIRKG